MEFLALGDLEVVGPPATPPPMRPKCRALLALLLVRANQTVLAEQLTEELWAGRPPSSAKTALRVHLVHLRRALATEEPGASPIGFAAGGYRISANESNFDVARFNAALARARRLLEFGEPKDGAALLDDALALWRGPAYADCLDLEPVRAEAVHLDSARVAAVELLADARLALGCPAVACDVLAPVVAMNPLRESLVERLMLALYRCGRQTEALRVFGRLRETLAEELGMPPGAAACALERSIVLQSRELDAQVATARTTSIQTEPRSSFIGRRAELAAIVDAWEVAKAGAVRLVLVSGPAGIGKSSLADQLRLAVVDGGGQAFVANCEPEPLTDYEPFPSLIRRMITSRITPLDHPEIVGELARLVPDLADQLPKPSPASDPTAGRHRLFSAVSALMTSGSRQPMLITLEDLHWASADTLALLRSVLSTTTSHLLVLGTYRGDEPGADALEAALAAGRLSRVDVAIRLGGLDTGQLNALVDADASEEVRKSLAGRMGELQHVSQGNPLFVREILRDLAEGEPDGGLLTIAPGGVRVIVKRRLNKLERPTRAALSAAAVLGSQFSLPALAATTRCSKSEALDAIEDGLESGLIEETGEVDVYVFSHPLVRNAIYAVTSLSRRARIHLRAADVLTQTRDGADGRWAEHAHHLLAALPLGDVERAAAAAVRAGDDAARCFAHGDAVEWYRRALELSREAAWEARTRGAVLLHLGQALEHDGRRDEARAAYVEATSIAKSAEVPDLLADIAIAATPRYVTVDDFHATQTEMVDDALEAIGDDPRRRGWLLCCAGASRYYGCSDGDCTRELRDLASQSADPEVHAASLIARHRLLTHRIDSSELRLALSRELVSHCVANHLDMLLGRATRSLLVDLLEVGRLSEFDDELVEFAQLATHRGVPADIFWAHALRATRALMRGDGAEDVVRAAHSIGREHAQSDAEGVFFLQQIALRHEQGRLHEIAGQLQPPCASPLADHRINSGLAALALVFAGAGNTKASRTILDQVVVEGSLLLPPDNLRLGATGLLGGAAAIAGTPAQRVAISRALLPIANRWCVFGAGGAVFGTGHHWLARLADADGEQQIAEHHWRLALQLAEDAGATRWARDAQRELLRLGAVGPDE